METILNNVMLYMPIVLYVFYYSSVWYINRRSNKALQGNDVDLIAAYAYIDARRHGKKIPRSAYGEWSKYTIND